MGKSMGTGQPRLIVVTGRPGAGKTTLAHALAKAVRCPAICRDEIKEGLVNTTGEVGEPGDALGREVYETFFETVRYLVSRKITVVAEAAFQHKLWAPKVETLRELAEVRVVVCSLDPRLARARHIERGLEDPQRELFHWDRVVTAAREGVVLPIGEYEPPKLDVPWLVVDTTDKYRPPFDDIVSFATS
jgi:predicted kinase